MAEGQHFWWFFQTLKKRDLPEADGKQQSHRTFRILRQGALVWLLKADLLGKSQPRLLWALGKSEFEQRPVGSGRQRGLAIS